MVWVITLNFFDEFQQKGQGETLVGCSLANQLQCGRSRSAIAKAFRNAARQY